MSGQMDSVRRQYGVPAKRGKRVTYDGHDATITSATGSHLRLRFERPDLQRKLGYFTFHPLHKIDYLDGIDPEDRAACHNERIRVWNEALNGRISSDEAFKRMAELSRELHDPASGDNP